MDDDEESVDGDFIQESGTRKLYNKTDDSVHRLQSVKRKKTRSKDVDDEGPSCANSSEVISGEKNERAERLKNKQHKKSEDNRNLERAIKILTDCGIPIDDMPDTEIMSTAMVIVQSRDDDRSRKPAVYDDTELNIVADSEDEVAQESQTKSDKPDSEQTLVEENKETIQMEHDDLTPTDIPLDVKRKRKTKGDNSHEALSISQALTSDFADLMVLGTDVDKDTDTPHTGSQELFEDYKYHPLQRKYTKAASRRMKHRQSLINSTYFAPVNRDPATYAVIIHRKFDRYFQKLVRLQLSCGSYIAWGQPVKVGRHMARTIDVKCRGQDSFSWSSSSDEEEHPQQKSKQQDVKMQPRRLVLSNKVFPTDRQSDDNLPDIPVGLGAETSGACTLSDDETQPICQSVVPQTLDMDNFYLAETQSDDDSSQIVIKSTDRNQLGDCVPHDSSSTSAQDAQRLQDSTKAPVCEDNSSRGSSILNSQGDIKPFQTKHQSVKRKTFNLELTDGDSETGSVTSRKKLCLSTKGDKKDSPRLQTKKSSAPCNRLREQSLSSDSDEPKKRKRESSNEDNSPVVKFTGRKCDKNSHGRKKRASVMKQEYDNKTDFLATDNDKRPRTTFAFLCEDERSFANSDVPGTQAVVQSVCPMCSKTFAADVIEQHADQCLMEVSSDSENKPDRDITLNRSGNWQNKPNKRDRDKGDNSEISPTALAKEKHYGPKTSHKIMDKCCICNEWISMDEIELHTDSCINLKLNSSSTEVEKDKRNTRSRVAQAKKQPTQEKIKFPHAIN